MYRLLKFELKLSPYISYIQQRVPFFRNKREIADVLGIMTFCHREYLRDKGNTSQMMITDELDRKVIENIRKNILHTFSVVIENRCYRMHLVLGQKDGHLKIFHKL